MKKQASKGLLKHLFFFGSGLFLFGLFVYLNRAEGWHHLRHVRLLPLAVALLASFGITASIAIRWGTLANAVGGGRKAAWHDYYHYFIISRILGFILPKDITDLAGRTAWLNQSHGFSLPQSGASVVLDRLFDVGTTAMFLAASLLYWLGWVSAQVAIGLMLAFTAVVGVLSLVCHKRFLIGLTWVIDGGFRLIHLLPWIGKRSSNSLQLTSLEQGVVQRVYLFSLFKFGCTTGRLVLFALALNVPISPTLILLGTPVAQLTYLFAFTPGGLGIFEAGWLAILILGEVSRDHAMIFVVGQRILTVILVGLLAVLSQLLYMGRVYCARRIEG